MRERKPFNLRGNTQKYCIRLAAFSKLVLLLAKRLRRKKVIFSGKQGFQGSELSPQLSFFTTEGTEFFFLTQRAQRFRKGRGGEGKAGRRRSQRLDLAVSGRLVACLHVACRFLTPCGLRSLSRLSPHRLSFFNHRGCGSPFKKHCFFDRLIPKFPQSPLHFFTSSHLHIFPSSPPPCTPKTPS